MSKGGGSLAGAAALLLVAPGIHAQITAEDFDVNRAQLMQEQMFVPYIVDDTRRLRDVLDVGWLDEETPLLLFADDVGAMAFLTEQLAYHHIAQGEIAGEPWMVSF